MDPVKQRELADKTIAAFKTVLEAHAKLAQPLELLTEQEKQTAHAQGDLSRCPRCGHPTPTVLPAPPLSVMCAQCRTTLEEHDGVMWFATMVRKHNERAQALNQEPSNDTEPKDEKPPEPPPPAA